MDAGGKYILIPITEKGRDSGYLTWPAVQEYNMNILLKGLDSVRLQFSDTDLGVKKINRKTRRIAIGPAHTKALDVSARTYKLSRRGDTLVIEVA